MANQPLVDPFTGTSGAPDSRVWDYFASAGCSGVMDANTLKYTMDGTSGDYAVCISWRADIGPDVEITYDVIMPSALTGSIRSEVYWRCLPASTAAGEVYWQDSFNFAIRDDGNYAIRKYEAAGAVVSFTGWVAYAISASDTIHVRIRHVGNSIRAKIWKNTAAEPTTWTQDISVASDPEPTAAGKVAMECWNTTAVAGSTAFDNFKVTTLTPPPVPVQSYYR